MKRHEVRAFNGLINGSRTEGMQQTREVRTVCLQITETHKQARVNRRIPASHLNVHTSHALAKSTAIISGIALVQ